MGFISQTYSEHWVNSKKSPCSKPNCMLLGKPTDVYEYFVDKYVEMRYSREIVHWSAAPNHSL